jgi:NAD(P)-dependent dehydrogenase (short-subunit alcohol dehydrogenase family)
VEQKNRDGLPSHSAWHLISDNVDNDSKPSGVRVDREPMPGDTMNELSSQVVLITGANGGLGTAVTEAFLAAGAVVVGTSLAITDADFPNPRFTAIAADLTDARSAQKLADNVMGRYQKIDTLVHVMGGFAGGKPIAETDQATWDRMISINLNSAVNILRAVIPRMRQAARGRIIAIGSRNAAEPSANLSAYNASKAALLSLVQTAALENKDLDITANAILPATMNTLANRKANPDADPAKWVQPERVAALVAFLASPAGAQITGAAIPVYGQEV